MSSFRLDSIGAWLSLVEHLVRDQGVGGSNPLAPIFLPEDSRGARVTSRDPDGSSPRPRAGRARFVAVIAGRVQGVGYRFFAQERARVHGLGGSVRNLPSGGVEVEAEGPDEALRAYLEELHHGPPAARVSDVSVRWSSAQGARDFVIRT